ncbi:nuclease-related domain-containing protein [Microbacterium oryzae]|uniref:NERD domain-containing protein n=1 Tax=Microbacterium oryzae TaxID=743009 RepID=A0A6I6EBB2_9MICO|nr:nuclease-related domain-containing protein [Microbacterium oryzae]QGU28338.1 NERD domain-containing protein [Microbacterium oryzae]
MTQWLWVACAVAAVLLIAVVVLLVVMRRDRKRTAQRIDEIEATHATEVGEQNRTHEEQVASLAQNHERQVVALSDEHDREVERMRSDVRNSQDVARRARETLATGLKWEAASRRLILRVCEQLGLRGSLLTNVVFMPDEGSPASFVTQVDHVLLLDGARVVIENKRWQGILFDGVRPSEVHPDFGKLIDETSLGERFALQLRSDREASSISIHRHVGERSPVVQVRRHAQQLSRFVEEEISEPIWFDTCVLYSHETAEAHLKQKDQTAGGATTWVVAGAAGLEECLSVLAGRPTSEDMQRDNAAVFRTLAALGADATTFGSDPVDQPGA